MNKGEKTEGTYCMKWQIKKLGKPVEVKMISYSPVRKEDRGRKQTSKGQRWSWRGDVIIDEVTVGRDTRMQKKRSTVPSFASTQSIPLCRF